MITFSKHSGVYTLEVVQALPINIHQAWSFFSTPGNLSKITPDHMGFKITSANSQQMYAGQIITYIIGLLPLVHSNWVTEITQVQENKFFIDEQRFGPYKMWHHEHHFYETGNTTIMKDIVTYKLPFGVFGRLFHPLLIKPQIEKIFEYRYQILNKLFV